MESNKDSNWLTNIVDTCGHLPQLIASKGEVDTIQRKLQTTGEHQTVKALYEDEQREVIPADNFLRGQLLCLGRSERISRAANVALSYWRYGKVYEVQKDQTASSPMIFRKSRYAQRADRGEVKFEGYMDHPGMGLEMECLTSFLTHSAKQRYVNDYHLNSFGDRKIFSGYTISFSQVNPDQSGFFPVYEYEEPNPIEETQVPKVAFELLESTVAPGLDPQEISRYDLDMTPFTECEEGQDLVDPADCEAVNRIRLIASVESHLAALQNALAELAFDPDESMRAAVASEVNCPTSTLVMLASDTSAQVRCGIARNPAATLDIIEILTGDLDNEVATTARTAKNLLLHPTNPWAPNTVQAA